MATFSRSQVAQTGVLPNGSRLLRETFPLKLTDVKEVITETSGGKLPVLRITGIFQKADDKNQNGRVYLMGILKEAVESIQPELQKRVVMGEFDHPPDAKIHLERVSHLITKVWMEGKYVYGQAEVLEGTTQGKNLSALLKAGVGIGISSRGVGDMQSVNEGSEELFMVQPGYRFVTWDVVGEPSVQEAVMSVMESKNHKVIVTRDIVRKVRPDIALVNEINDWLKD
jgi:hypothetical protein